MITIAHQDSPGPETEQVEVIGGVDTHRDSHTAAVIDMAGRLLGSAQFPASGSGYQGLLAWLRTFGIVLVLGVEGTGSYGAGLAGYLHRQQMAVLEVDRPDRKTRRLAGKSDPIDAEAAARAALARVRTGVPKVHDGQVEALRNLRVARRSAVQARSDCMRQIKTLIVTAAEPLRARLRELSNRQLLAACARLRADTARIGEPEQATKASLRTLARRHAFLSEQVSELDQLIDPLVTAINPDLLELTGVGPEVAGQLLVTAGQNSDRLHSEAAFAMLCGVAPLPASSGRTHRHRLNRGGDRQANKALHTVAISRLRWDPRTQDYMQRRTAEGLSKKDIIRCLKRYIAREIFHLLTARPATTTHHHTAA